MTQMKSSELIDRCQGAWLSRSSLHRKSELPKSDCLAIAIDSLANIRFCDKLENIRADLAEQDGSSESLLEGFQQVAGRVEDTTEEVRIIYNAGSTLAKDLRNRLANIGDLLTRFQQSTLQLARVVDRVAMAGKGGLDSASSSGSTPEGEKTVRKTDGLGRADSGPGMTSGSFSSTDSRAATLESLRADWEAAEKTLNEFTRSITAALAETESYSHKLATAEQNLSQLSSTVGRMADNLVEMKGEIHSTSRKTSDLSVLAQAYENLVIQLKQFGEARPDPLSRFEVIARGSNFFDAQRFSASERETVLIDDEVIISLTDPKGIIVYANETFCRTSEYEMNELIGKPQNLIRHPDMPKGVFADLWADIKAGKMWQGYIKNRARSGRIYWVKAAIFPHYSESTIVGYISVRKKAEPEAIARAKEIYRRIP